MNITGNHAPRVNTTRSTSAQGTPDPLLSGMSGMQLTFMVTGVVGGLAALLGIIYLILYHTRMSTSSRRKMLRQNNNMQEARLSLREESKRRESRRESHTRRSNTQTHFSLFKAKR